ncbi:alkyl/aryl-sulfatase [Arsukibacterium sp.]|uniref:alkyl/aryl-sulfatase n=1 Tax=Arsukibacterium sp. TaxID=1977258 RepID=UPI002FDA4CEF
MSSFIRSILVCCSLWLLGCDAHKAMPPRDASTATAEASAQWQQRDLTIDSATHEAYRGLIAAPSGKIYGPEGEVLVDFNEFTFINGAAPASVNPSLWRHARLNAQAGLFKVTEGIYQLRGFDLANMTLIVGQSGWIVVDPLTSKETAAAALAFARQHLGPVPVTAIIFTHSHVDHFGGALGIVSSAELASRPIPIIAPAGFLEEATSENILVGPIMSRRSMYQFGKNLPGGPDGFVDNGLGKRVAYGTIDILAPTHSISHTLEPLSLDGIEFIFYNTPGAEAPAELTFRIPQYRAYAGAELLGHTMHNLLPVRGAKARDALRWAQYLQEALEQLYDTEVYFGQHHWPVWGQEPIREFISKQRDLYKYLHDQTIRLANAGYTPLDIAEQIQLPASLATYFANRGYYGDIRHNVKAIYQFYLGAYDGNPANLNPLSPVEAATRYVALMGGSAKVYEAAELAYAAGEYRWVAQLLNHVVFAAPDYLPAKQLLAQTYMQLAYQAEASTWRNSYLTAAQELIQGPPTAGVKRQHLFGLMLSTPTERFLEALAASVNGPKADGAGLILHLHITDTAESFVLWLENAVLHHRPLRPEVTQPAAEVSLHITKPLLLQLLTGSAGISDLLLNKNVQLSGNTLQLVTFFRLLDKAPENFPIVTPRTQ